MFQKAPLLFALLGIILLPAQSADTNGSSAEIIKIEKRTFFYDPSSRQECQYLDTYKIPGFDSTFTIHDDCSYPVVPSDISTALSLIYTQWVNEFGDTGYRFLHILNNLEIEFAGKMIVMKHVYTHNGQYREEAPLNGLCYDSGHKIWLYSRGQVDIRLSKTSFVHELVHSGIYAKNKYEHGDPDHLGPNYSGWKRKHSDFIRRMNIYLESLGL